MLDVLSRPAPTADHRIPYGSRECQFGDLWLPQNSDGSLFPVVVFFHGGWWKSEYDLNYAGHLCADLKKRGIACWSVEYRRVGSSGGGWPMTFKDAAAGFDFVATLAKSYPLDLTRVVIVGHSAGGHLAFWIAGRRNINRASELYEPRPEVLVRTAIALAGAVDLRMTLDLARGFTATNDKQEVIDLMGGRPEDVPERYKAGNPGELLPFGVPQILLQGSDDDEIPPGLPSQWFERARLRGDAVYVQTLPRAGHLDIVDPESKAWEIVRDTVLTALEL